MAVHKKQTAAKLAGKEEKPAEIKVEEVKTTAFDKSFGESKEPMIVSDVITETVEVVEAPVQSDPLNDFKEKVNEEMNMPNRPAKNYMWPVFFIFIIAVVLLGGVFAYRQGVFKAIKINMAPAASPTPTITPEPTKAPTVDLSKFEIEVLNGSSVSGLASQQKATLEAAGFTVSSVGNADNSDYTDTIIKTKTEVDPGFIAKLKSTLGETFTVGDTQSLSEDSSVPVVVILGTKK